MRVCPGGVFAFCVICASAASTLKAVNTALDVCAGCSTGTSERTPLIWVGSLAHVRNYGKPLVSSANPSILQNLLEGKMIAEYQGFAKWCSTLANLRCGVPCTRPRDTTKT